jgi:hypothetical protein
MRPSEGIARMSLPRTADRHSLAEAARALFEMRVGV